MNILITGAGRGIGLEVAIQAAKAGHRVMAVSRKTVYPAPEDAIAGSIIPFRFDLTSHDHLPLIHALEDHGMTGPEVVICNAGILVNKPFGMLSDTEIENIFSVNVFSVFRLIRVLLPSLKPDCHIVTIGSMGGFQGSSKYPGLSAYSASKAALACLSECLAAELEPLKIKVNCIAPGATDTDMLKEAFPGYKAPVTAVDMAGEILRFALHAHTVINGRVIPFALSNP